MQNDKKLNKSKAQSKSELKGSSTNTEQSLAIVPIKSLSDFINKKNNSQSNSIDIKVTDQKLLDIKTLEEKYPYLLTGTSLLKLPPDLVPNLWDPFMKRYGLTTLTGSSDLGKSSFLRQLAVSVTLKETLFLGHPLNVRYGRVIYFTTEDNKASISSLLLKQLPSVNPDDFADLIYIFNAEEPLGAIEEQLKCSPTDLVIIDCVSDIFDGQMNDMGHVRKFLNQFDKLSIKYDCLFIFLHHNGKRTEVNGPNKHNIVGSQGYEAKMRLVMELRREGDQVRSLWFTKGNYLSELIKKQSLELEFTDNQEFIFTGNHHLKVACNNKFDNSKKEILEKIRVYQKIKGMTQDKMVSELKLLYPKSGPSKGTLNKWVKEIENEGTISDESISHV